MLSGCAGQPGMQTIGTPRRERQPQPRKSGRPIAPVGLFFIAGTPPYVAQVPTATSAAAFGASRSIHSLTVIGWPSIGSTPKPVQWPSPLRRSSPIAPSTTSRNGSSRPSSASYQACRNSAPFS